MTGTSPSPARNPSGRPPHQQAARLRTPPVEDEMTLPRDHARPVLYEVAFGRPSVDYRALVEESAHPAGVEFRRSLLQTAIDAVAFLEAIDEGPGVGTARRATRHASVARTRERCK